MSESVMVAVRCRPFNKREIALGSKVIVQMHGAKTTLLDPTGAVAPKEFTFDYSYWSFDSSSPSFATNPKVYSDLGVSVLNNAWAGYNVCLFAYGQTGSGKSYSMVGYGEDKGIVPQAMEEMFVRIKNNKDKNVKYLVEASMMEIYNEKVKDLFNPDEGGRSVGGLKVRDNPSSGPYVEGLSRSVLTSFKEFEDLLSEGNAVRTVAATQMNATSSRAHTVFQIVFTTTTHDEETNKSSAKTSKINLVDLAGSERLSKTGASGQQMKEGIGINKSLTALGNCIEKLAKKSSAAKGKEVHVPYRDSVLTYLLKESLGGNAKTIMIAAVSPADDNYDESLSTLRYADRAKCIKNSAVVNEDENGRVIRELKKEIAALRDALAKGAAAGAAGGGPSSGGGPNSNLSDKEKADYLALKEQMKQNEDLVARMNMSWEEKMKETEQLAFKRAAALNAHTDDVAAKKKRMPYMVNLHKDASMSQVLTYFFPPGVTRMVTKAADPPPGEDDIILSGLQIRPNHASVEHDAAANTLHITPGEGARVFLNGKLVRERTEAVHNDRLICGAHLVFRILFPNHATEDADSMFDWEYANKELTTSTIEALNQPDPETLRQQKEQEEKMARMQEEIEAERVRSKAEQERKQREYESTLREIARKKEDEIAATKLAIEQASAADSLKLSKKLAEREAELEREGALAAKLHSERLEAMRKEQAALEAKLAAQRAETQLLHKKHEVEKRDRQLLEENLMHVIPLVNEANAIVTELGQALRYSIKLEAKRSLDDDGFTEHTDVFIRVVNLDDDMEVLWDMDTLSEALYMMREIYNDYMRSGEIDIPENKADNPFHLVPNGPMLIGSARLYLQPCYFLLPINESTAIIDYKGEHKGQLYVNLLPIPPRDEDTKHLNLREDELFFEEEDLAELKGEPLTLKLEIKKCMGLPQKYSSNVYVTYKFFYDTTESKTDPVQGAPTINPLISYERTLLVDLIEDEFIEYVKSGILEFKVYGEQVIQEEEAEVPKAGSNAAGNSSARKRGGASKRSSAVGGSAAGAVDAALSARLAKLEMVLRDITQTVVDEPTDAVPDQLREDPVDAVLKTPEIITSKIRALRDENTELKSPVKQRLFGAGGAESEAAAAAAAEEKERLLAENAKIKAEIESLRAKSAAASAKGQGGAGMFPEAEAEAAAQAAAQHEEEKQRLIAEIEALKASSAAAAAAAPASASDDAAAAVAAAAAAAQAENLSLKAALESLKSKAAPGESELADLRAALAAKEAEAAELRALQATEAALNKELAAKLEQGVSQSATASVVNRHAAELEQTKRELASARDKLAQATPHSNDSAEEIEELRRRIKEEQDRYAELEKKKGSSACAIL